LKEILEAFKSLREQWGRTILTASGVMAATIAVVLLASIAIGVRKDFTESLTDLGINNLVVLPGKLGDGFNFNLGGASYLKPADAKALEKVKGVIRTSSWTFVGGSATYKDKSAPSFLVATTASWFEMKRFDLESGRLMTPEDAYKDVCVIGTIAKEGAFGKKDAVGKSLSINGRSFEVIGVTTDEKAGDSLSAMGGFQNLIYLPYEGLQKRRPESQTDRILIQIDPNAEPIALLAKLKKTLALTHDESEFDILTQKDLLKLVFKFSDILQWLLVGLTSIALFVGGIGIMNVMLLSVGERTSEIGIRKALGAPQSSIFRQFLAESVGISLAGSAAGLIFSSGVCLLIAKFTPINPIVTWQTIFGTIGASLVTGILFGLLPSMKASKKDPVRAIQNLG
jgi:putative ABC transport system permease protein